MYYRNANCAVVVYDITQAVRITPFSHTISKNPKSQGLYLQKPYQLTKLPLVLPRQSQSLGQRTPTPSKRKHHHRTRRQQIRPRRLPTRQTRHRHRRRRSLRPRSRSAVLRNERQDGGECPRIIHGYRKEIAFGAGGSERDESRGEAECGSETRGTGDAGSGWV